MGRRLHAFSLVMCLLFTVVCGRVLYVARSGDFAVGQSYNSYTLLFEQNDTEITDRMGRSMGGTRKEWVAVIRPTQDCLRELPRLFAPGDVQRIAKELQKGYPVLEPVATKADTNHIVIMERTVRDSTTLHARQLLDRASGGLGQYTAVATEKKLNFATDAMGRVLSGNAMTEQTDRTGAPATMRTTLDLELQKTVEQAAESIKTGAVVVLDVPTGEVRAVYSAPADYYNRALSAYAVGSVFKLIVAAAALEADLQPVYTCKGEIKVGDTVYRCQNGRVHGRQTMEQALAHSCNCYFVQLAQKLGAGRLYQMGLDFGFGTPITLYKDFQSAAGRLPSLSVLASPGQLALLGFGQGKLTDTPLHFARCVAAIAGGGVYCSPDLTGKATAKPRRVMQARHAKTLLAYMRTVVAAGTGSSADYRGRSAGKTATAQSGRYVQGREVLNTYFAGVYPFDNPRYAIVVMRENGTSGAADCCPVFRRIVSSLP